MSFEQFKDQEKELTEVGIPELGKQADFKIENTGTPEDLFKKVDEIINSLV
jgi:dephospho-CoA kinase